MSKPTRSEIDELRSDKLPYQKNCALMALAKTERKGSTQMLSELKGQQSLDSGKSLENDNTLLSTIENRGYTSVTKGFSSWKDAQTTLRNLHQHQSSPKSTRYFAMTYSPGSDLTSQTAVGHAVSLSVGRGGGVSVFANNSDRTDKHKWMTVGGQAPHQTGGRPFQKSMSPDHQIQIFAMPSKKKK